MYKYVFSLISFISFSAFATDTPNEVGQVKQQSTYYTAEEIQNAKTLGQSLKTLRELYAEGKTCWFSLTEETYNYKNTIHKNYVLVRMDDQLKNNYWCGMIALFPMTEGSLSKVYRTYLGFNDIVGTPFESNIQFNYYPGNTEATPKPYVVLSKSETYSENRGKGYNQFTRRCFIDFVKKYTNAELIFSDARNPASKHILTKSEFGFQDGKGNKDLLPYMKGMAVPYYLMINR